MEEIKKVEPLLTVREVSQILRVSINYVYALRDSGALAFVKIGSYKVEPDELRRFIRDCAGKDATDPHNIKSLY